MAKDPQRSGNKGRETTPPRAPEITPPATPQYTGSDYSFTLQAVMEMQKTLGGLTQAVTTLTNQLHSDDAKIDRIDSRIHRMEKIIYAASALVTVLLGIGVFFDQS